MPNRVRIGILVVFLVIFLGVGMLVPAVQKVREAANRVACSGNLCFVALAIHNYADTYHRLPLAAWSHDELPSEKRLSWMAAIMPFMESDTLYKRFKKDLGWEAAEHQEFLQTSIRPFICRSSMSSEEAREYYRTHYVGITGVGANATSLAYDDPNRGAFSYEHSIRFDGMKDGTSVTLLLAETSLDNGPWLAAGRPTVRGYVSNLEPLIGKDGQFGGFHVQRWYPGSSPGGVNVSFADGSRRTLLPTISPRVFQALCTIAGGEDADHDLD